MKLKDHHCSLIKAKMFIIAGGIGTRNVFTWRLIIGLDTWDRPVGRPRWTTDPSVFGQVLKTAPAFTETELAEVLFWFSEKFPHVFYPNVILTKFKEKKKKWAGGRALPFANTQPIFHGATRADVYADLVLWLIKKNKMTIQQVNKIINK